jgi:sirohydrochlorin ferrochelatase
LRSEALIVFAHGSRVAEANESVREVARTAAQLGGFPLWREAFLELAEPSLAEAVEDLAAQGADRIVVAPYFLVMGVHLKSDLPKLLAEASERAPGVLLIQSEPLGGHPTLAKALAERAVEALS